MTAALSPEDLNMSARGFAFGLVQSDQHRHGGSVQDARRRVARRIGIAPGTLETLARGRLKRLEAWVFVRLARGAIDDLRREIVNHENRLANARRCLGDLGSPEIHAIEEGLADLRRALAAMARTIEPGGTDATCARSSGITAAAGPVG